MDSEDTTAIGDPNRPGALICRSEDRARVSWHFTNGVIVSTAPTRFLTYKQIRTKQGVTPSVSEEM